MANIRVGKITAVVSTAAAHARIGWISGHITTSTAAARLGQIQVAVIPQVAAKARVGRISGHVTAPAGAAHARVGKVNAVVTAPNSNPPLVRVRSGGAWKTTTTPSVYRGGAWKIATPQIRSGGAWKPLAPIAPPPPPPTPALAGFTAVSADQFATLDTSAWYAYDNSTFGSPTRVQRYMARNLLTGSGSSGTTGGTSLRMLSKRESVGGNSFTAGMLDSKTVGKYYPRYGRFEARMKIPHGQGLWPAWWLTAKNGGATMVEIDIMEYFHSQIPGKTLTTLHRTNNAGTFQANVAKNTGGKFFENPTLTPGWHTIAIEIKPPAGMDVTQPNTNVTLTAYLDGVQYWTYTDTQALYWTTNGGDADSFYNVYLQGCQIDGNYVGSPDGPLGYSHWTNACLAGGTAPNSCTTVVGGIAMQLPTFGDPSSTFEVDYHKVWKYTG